ncbi:glycosyltransferase family 2 protein [Rhizobium laguerreae]|uniref:glycosyltransferase family 2 protein n=1 Tax=Rhizobium laguerreae TaxID=1076926 RepID=UPI001C90249A|nr:glycosyltransferase family A protein [Rhizobium laguerreae]MBY3347976.1 glycosyltransferase family 2 protein [Rhizobium laguerreae]MBY3354939.1 glycosyltransferase family 2 protein [Rhizobium laguerreae]MBY3376244.1 glycosyltransferase family 2 protein [Rhizobium laguerreae]MBY3431243.1 glycosyltransferase family 2 protein [Rhizobium laguerreae]MBY3439859.1 glycosyltransferase family 2 protein [Rhizobium laguerreae]
MNGISPRVSVIVTHYNYARYIAEALQSVRQQSIDDWEIIIVDDCSDVGEFALVERIVAEMGDNRIKLVRNSSNLGQISAIFEGVDQAKGDFISLLDPDDRYESTFLETMLAAFLNPRQMIGVAACEMGIFHDRYGVLSLHSTSFRYHAVMEGRYDETTTSQLLNGFSAYIPSWKQGWHWVATSGMMFRRAILDLIRPSKPVTFTRFEGDSYCGHGCHMIAGSAFVDQMLSWRRVHDNNTAKNPVLIFEYQNKLKPEFANSLGDSMLLAAEAILSTTKLSSAAKANLMPSISAHIGHQGILTLTQRSESARDIIWACAVGGT